MVTENLVLIAWKDHYSLAGWHNRDEIYPEGHINSSVGFLVDTESMEYTTLAQTVYPTGDVYGDLIHILDANIVSVTHLSLGETIEDLGD
jgi:hypothetical protein